MENTSSWYSELIKPSWAPPDWLFGPAWSVLYLIIFIAFGSVFYKVFTDKLPLFVVLPFVLNLIFNFAFTPLQFGLRNNFLAAVDIVLILITIIWCIIAILPHVRWVSFALAPYLLWVTFATALQLSITYLNR